MGIPKRSQIIDKLAKIRTSKLKEIEDSLTSFINQSTNIPIRFPLEEIKKDPENAVIIQKIIELCKNCEWRTEVITNEKNISFLELS